MTVVLAREAAVNLALLIAVPGVLLTAASSALPMALAGRKPDQAWMWSHLGHLLTEQQLWEEAEGALAQALLIDQEDLATRERLARLKEMRP